MLTEYQEDMASKSPMEQAQQAARMAAEDNNAAEEVVVDAHPETAVTLPPATSPPPGLSDEQLMVHELASLGLRQFADDLRALHGVATVADLASMSERDLATLGMTRVQRLRFFHKFVKHTIE